MHFRDPIQEIPKRIAFSRRPYTTKWNLRDPLYKNAFARPPPIQKTRSFPPTNFE